MRLLWTIDALDDRRTIYEFIEANSISAALTLDEKFSESANQLISFPNMGRIGRIKGTRELIVHPNFLLIYDISGDLLRIIRVLHAAQQWPQIRPLDE